MKFGITLSNRAVLLGLCSVEDLLRLAEAVDTTPGFDSVWCGDALFVNRRLDATMLLAAVAARTERMLIGTACMGSFALRDPLVFAYEWASLDVLSNGRTRLVACAGGGASPLWEAESKAMRVAPQDRRKRMLENMRVLRHLWSVDGEPFKGEFVSFAGITLEPKPVQTPCPIWLATNAERLSRGQADRGGSDFALRRVATFADGWMTHSVTPEGFRRSWELILDAARAQRREPAALDNALYHHINVSDDREASFADSKRFLDLYYGANYGRERIESWLTYGTPADCIAGIRRYIGCGCNRMTFRISTMGNPMAQFRRLVEEVLPHVCEGASSR
jgi:alkanesulfonate monooxygenase SsuD/methylene tetrahydromethanopterin reductase-like flavin-dependent oxidoreductase (luciferase family)